MNSVPFENAAYRGAIRRRITLDLFTRYGPVWDAIKDVREREGAIAVVQLPPDPPPHSMLWYPARPHSPERVHLPPFPTGVEGLRDLHAVCVPEDNPSGTDALAWLRWTPFLSACVIYDPPALSLLEFADHDDHEVSQRQVQTYFEEVERRTRADVGFQHEMTWTEFARSADQGCEECITEADEQSLNILERYHRNRRSSYRPSTVPAEPARPRGRPPLDELTAVQCAIWKRHGRTYREISVQLGWPEDEASYDPRQRKNRAIDHVKRGEHILSCRNYSG